MCVWRKMTRRPVIFFWNSGKYVQMGSQDLTWTHTALIWWCYFKQFSAGRLAALIAFQSPLFYHHHFRHTYIQSVSPPSVSFLSLGWEVSKKQFRSWAGGGLDCFRDILGLIDLFAFGWVMFSCCFPLTRWWWWASFFLVMLLFYFCSFVKHTQCWFWWSIELTLKETVFLFFPEIRRRYSTLGCIWMMAELLNPQLFSSPRSSLAKSFYPPILLLRLPHLHRVS